MLALGLYRADLHDCGHRLSESTRPDAEGRYLAEAPTRCHACTAIAAKQSDYTEVKHARALLWRAERR